MLLNNQSGTTTNETVESAVTTDYIANFSITVNQNRGTVINFTAWVNDTANNIQQSSTLITVENTEPTISITFPALNTLYNVDVLDLNITASDVDGDTITAYNLACKQYFQPKQLDM